MSPIPFTLGSHAPRWVPPLRSVAFTLLLMAGGGCDPVQFQMDRAEDRDGDGFTAFEGDCDEFSASTYPEAEEICNRVDDDCDGTVDDDVFIFYYPDLDNDGFGDQDSDSIPGECILEIYQAASNDDCDDRSDEVHPGAIERCDGIDNDCDDEVDTDTSKSDMFVYYRDYDLDTFGADDTTLSSCEFVAPDGFVNRGGDCDDADTNINPAVIEVCDGIDSNCDNFADTDAEFDSNPPNDIPDCQDERCDGIDNNGIDGTDEGYPDFDDDGAADCIDNDDDNDGYDFAQDCNDYDPDINPGEIEVCDNDDIDENCNGMSEDADPTTQFPDNQVVLFPDRDSDTYGDSDASGINYCLPRPAGYVENNFDCDDYNPTVHPGTIETCDNIDQDCDDDVDEGAGDTWYEDIDQDGYGNPDEGIPSCTDPSDATTHYVSNLLDCDDEDATLSPDADEICNDIDDDCDGLEDDKIVDTYYEDKDGDRFGLTAVTKTASSCDPPAGWSLTKGDCDDNNRDIFPEAAEVCNVADDDCNGIIDDDRDQVTYYRDSDGDGFGDAARQELNCCPPSGYVADRTDCNDESAISYPGASEVIGDNKDEDCDKKELCYKDGDYDDYRPDPNTTVVSQDADCYDTGEAPEGTPDGDCDDTNPGINPNAFESCNELDDNCNGENDEGLKTSYYSDNDADGFGSDDSRISSCDPPGTFITIGGDCDDNNGAVNPTAVEVCNALDDDCDGWLSHTVAGGFGHSLYCENGKIWAWGYNGDGQLGEAKLRGYYDTPIQVPDLSNVVEVAAGSYFSMALTGEQRVMTFGSNSSGQLGTGSNTASSVPVTVPNLFNVVAIAAGSTHALALKSDGTVWAWGANFDGQLGNGSNTNATSPVQVSDLTSVVAIQAGKASSYAVTSNGNVLAWGQNDYGQLGNGSSTSSNIPIGSYLYSAVAIAAGDAHVLAIDAGGSVWAWGDNSQGQLGTGWGNALSPTTVGLDRASGVGAGSAHSFAVLEDGSVYAWGANAAGQLGNGTYSTLYGPELLNNLLGIQVDGGYQHSLSVDPTLDLKSWGSNEEYQLGNNSYANSPSPVSPDTSCEATWYKDADNDNHGRSDIDLIACVRPDGFASTSDDCNDSDSSVYTGATEIIDNASDENCNNQETCYKDADDDGYISTDGGKVESVDLDCSDSGEGSAGEAQSAVDDCNDANAAISPADPEICSGTDDDCDGSINEDNVCYVAISLTNRSQLCPTQTGGDREFDGNGPNVDGSASLSIRNDTEIVETIYLHEIETQSDWTECEGTWEYVVATAADGCTIKRITTDSYTGFSYTDDDLEPDTIYPYQDYLILYFTVMGDTDDDDIGACSPSDAYISVTHYGAMQYELDCP